MIQLVAIDLDGTLFNHRQEVSPANRQAIQKAIENGIKIVIATGRGQSGVRRVLAMLDMDLPFICSAGSLAFAGLNGAVLYANTFHNIDEIKPVIEFARATDMGLIADTAQGTSLWFGPDTLEEVMDPMTAADAYKSVRTLMPETDFDQPLLKLTIAAEMPLLLQVEQILREKGPSIHQTFSGLNYIDLTRHGVNKGSALAALAAHWHIAPAAVAAIGDQAIDHEMLAFSGLPIAMQNAVDSLKQAAQWIAPSNDEDGVAWALERIVKENKKVKKILSKRMIR